MCVCFASHPYMVDWIMGIIYRFHKLGLRQSVLQSDMSDVLVWSFWDAFDVRQTFPLNLVFFFFLIGLTFAWLTLSCMNSQWRVEQMKFHFIRINNNFFGANVYRGLFFLNETVNKNKFLVHFKFKIYCLPRNGFIFNESSLDIVYPNEIVVISGKYLFRSPTPFGCPDDQSHA